MKKISIVLLVWLSAIFAESDSLWNCIIENCSQTAPTQASTGEYRWKSYSDTLEGEFFYLPPQATYLVSGDSIVKIGFFSLKDPWFDWWIERNPVRLGHLYETALVKDSLAFRIYDHKSISAEHPNVRAAYDRGSCELFSALFYWPAEAGHGFPGADAIYYEFTITDQYALAPTKRLYLNRSGDIVDELIFESARSARDTPTDSLIIHKLLSHESFE